MLDSSWAWALFTVIAAFSQTVRNAAQRQLTAKLGTVGATHVRFLFGFPFALAFLVATAGVVLMWLKPGTAAGGMRPTLSGVAAGAMFGLSAVGFRGAILSLGLPSYLMAATFTLVIGLLLQSVLLSAYLWLRDPKVLTAIMRSWRPSLFAGFMGALASQFWFLAFALATAASVRTLALVEVLFAQAISRFVFKQPTTRREALGIILIVIGCTLLIWAS